MNLVINMQVKAPLTQAEAQNLATAYIGKFLSECCIEAGATEREMIGNYLMKLVSVAGAVMAQAEGSEVACSRLEDTAAFILRRMPKEPAKIARMQ